MRIVPNRARRAERRGLRLAGRLYAACASILRFPRTLIIRPRGIYYTDGEFAAMLEDIRLVRERAGVSWPLPAC